MIENIAIIILALLSQINIVTGDAGLNQILNQFVKNDSVNVSTNKENWNTYKIISENEAEIRPLPSRIKNNKINIDSSSAIAFDVGTDYILYSKDIKKKLPIASLTKIMTSIIVLENNNLDDVVVINQSALQTEGRKVGLLTGEKITVDNLLKIMLVSSNNIAAVALAEHTGGDVKNFVELMNQKAKVLGLDDTEFYNPTGLDEVNINISTAYDVAQLVDYALEKSIIWEYSKTKSVTASSVDEKINHKVNNTNQLLGVMENVIGGKTGFTDMAGECLMIIRADPRDENNRVITVVLNAQDRFMQTQRLQNWVWENYKW
ncbi:D-alanyl-D-alanine carboxypeptidase [Patescibacteria group bacterium]|nr:D-alanyl-D-alanine carboxypeptidase [Patescibacteria group bacterium]